MAGSCLKTCGIVLLIIHLVLICLNILDQVLTVTNQELKDIYVWSKNITYSADNKKPAPADELESFATTFVVIHSIFIGIYALFLVLSGLALKGVFSAGRCLIVMGVVGAILGCFVDGFALSVNYKDWEYSLRVKGYVILYGFTVIVDIAQTVVLFALRCSSGKGGAA